MSLPPDAAERRYKRKGEPFRTTYYSGKCWSKYDLAALGWRHRRHYDMRATFITLAIDVGPREWERGAGSSSCTHAVDHA